MIYTGKQLKEMVNHMNDDDQVRILTTIEFAAGNVVGDHMSSINVLCMEDFNKEFGDFEDDIDHVIMVTGKEDSDDSDYFEG